MPAADESGRESEAARVHDFKHEQYFYAVYTSAFKPYMGLCVCALWRKR